jgi:hypothetical protein
MMNTIKKATPRYGSWYIDANTESRTASKIAKPGNSNANAPRTRAKIALM